MGYSPTTTASTLHVLLGVVKTFGVMTNGSAALACTSFGFVAADVGRYCMVFGAGPGGAPIITTVTAFTDSTHVTIGTAASTTVSDVTVIVWRPRGVLLPSIRLNNVLSWTGRDTCAFTIQSSSTDADFPYVPEVGTPVLLTDDNEGVLFGGTIEDTADVNPSGKRVIETACTCVGYHQLAGKRTTGQPDSGTPGVNPQFGTWTNETAGAIFAYLVIHALDGDGMGVVAETGPVISEFSVAYEMCDSACNRLAGISNDGADLYFWRVDAWRVAHFEKATTNAAPWNISDLDTSDGNVLMQVTVKRTRSKFCNTSIINLGSYTLPEAPETYTGDGTATQFAVTVPIAAEPTVTISLGGGADTPQTVGVLNDPTTGTGKDWYWSLGSNILTQDAGGAVLTGADSITITYQGSSTAFFQYRNSASVDERTEIEGGTGFYELVTEVSTPTGSADASALAQSIATAYGSIPAQIQVQTFRGGLKAGQEITVHLTGRVTGTFLIDSVTLTVQSNRKLWTATAVDGALVGDWRTSLKNLSGGGSGSGGVVVGGSGTGGAGASYLTIQTLTAGATVSAPAAATDRAIWIACVKMDATGGWPVTWGTGTDIYNAPEISATVNSDPSTMCLVTFTGVGSVWVCTAAMLGVRAI